MTLATFLTASRLATAHSREAMMAENHQRGAISFKTGLRIRYLPVASTSSMTGTVRNAMSTRLASSAADIADIGTSTNFTTSFATLFFCSQSSVAGRVGSLRLLTEMTFPVRSAAVRIGESLGTRSAPLGNLLSYTTAGA